MWWERKQNLFCGSIERCTGPLKRGKLGKNGRKGWKHATTKCSEGEGKMIVVVVLTVLSDACLRDHFSTTTLALSLSLSHSLHLQLITFSLLHCRRLSPLNELLWSKLSLWFIHSPSLSRSVIKFLPHGSRGRLLRESCG